MFERPNEAIRCVVQSNVNGGSSQLFGHRQKEIVQQLYSLLQSYIQSVVGNVLITAIRMSAVAFPFVRNKVDKRLSAAPYANIPKKNRRKSFSIGLNHWHAQVSINRHTFWKEKCTHLMAARSCSVAKIVFFATPFSVTSFHHGFENTIGNTSNRNK